MRRCTIAACVCVLPGESARGSRRGARRGCPRRAAWPPCTRTAHRAGRPSAAAGTHAPSRTCVPLGTRGPHGTLGAYSRYSRGACSAASGPHRLSIETDQLIEPRTIEQASKQTNKHTSTLPDGRPKAQRQRQMGWHGGYLSHLCPRLIEPQQTPTLPELDRLLVNGAGRQAGGRGGW